MSIKDPGDRIVRFNVFATAHGVELRTYELDSEVPYDVKRYSMDEARKLAAALLSASYLQQSGLTVRGTTSPRAVVPARATKSADESADTPSSGNTGGDS